MTDETRDLLEGAVQDHLKKLNAITEIGGDESKKITENLTKLTELLITSDKDNYDYYDKQERRRIEEERNEAANETERNKQKLTWSRVAFEMAKVVVPVGISMIGYNIFQKRVLKFEETGRISSTAGRELHLPKFTK